MAWRVKPICPRCRRVQCTCPTPYIRGKQRWSSKEAREYKAAAIADWVARHGWTCPGYHCPAHESHDLTAHHVQPIAEGGDPLGPVMILCRSCHGRLTNFGQR